MNKTGKRALAALLTALLLCTLCACGQPKAASGAGAPESAEDVQRFVGQTIEDFVKVCGEPLASEYAPSCLGPGEDGTHSFADWTVYTYKENGTETIRIITPAA